MRRFIILGVVIFAISVLLIVLFSGRGGQPSAPSTDEKITKLVDYAKTPTEVRFTQEGRINARESHRVLQISVGQNERTITVYEGFSGNILKTQTFLNDPDAYRSFLAGLEDSGYTSKRVVSDNIDPLGVCPDGNRYRYDIVSGNDNKQSLWSTSCSVKGTFAGRATLVRTLFRNQIPGFDAFVKGVQF